MVHGATQMNPDWIYLLEPANDNAPHDPLDYEDFDPSVIPYDGDMTLDCLDVMELLSL
jgi:hypothetical protein